MVGGIVTCVIPCDGKVWVDCEERDSTSKCAIWVLRDKKSQKILPGDSIWWQGDMAFHTPYASPKKNQGVDFDIGLVKIGNSGAYYPSDNRI